MEITTFLAYEINLSSKSKSPPVPAAYKVLKLPGSHPIQSLVVCYSLHSCERLWTFTKFPVLKSARLCFSGFPQQNPNLISKRFLEVKCFEPPNLNCVTSWAEVIWKLCDTAAGRLGNIHVYALANSQHASWAGD